VSRIRAEIGELDLALQARAEELGGRADPGDRRPQRAGAIRSPPLP
jgi:hypothetical protein